MRGMNRAGAVSGRAICRTLAGAAIAVAAMVAAGCGDDDAATADAARSPGSAVDAAAACEALLAIDATQIDHSRRAQGLREFAGSGAPSRPPPTRRSPRAPPTSPRRSRPPWRAAI